MFIYLGSQIINAGHITRVSSCGDEVDIEVAGRVHHWKPERSEKEDAAVAAKRGFAALVKTLNALHPGEPLPLPTTGRKGAK
jgi:hypothetical protein